VGFHSLIIKETPSIYVWGFIFLAKKSVLTNPNIYLNYPDSVLNIFFVFKIDSLASSLFQLSLCKANKMGLLVNYKLYMLQHIKFVRNFVMNNENIKL